jgi:hypothetical protein
LLDEAIERFLDQSAVAIARAELAARGGAADAIDRWTKVRNRLPSVTIGYIAPAKIARSAEDSDAAEELLGQAHARFGSDSGVLTECLAGEFAWASCYGGDALAAGAPSASGHGSRLHLRGSRRGRNGRRLEFCRGLPSFGQAEIANMACFRWPHFPQGFVLRR